MAVALQKSSLRIEAMGDVDELELCYRRRSGHVIIGVVSSRPESVDDNFEAGAAA